MDAERGDQPGGIQWLWRELEQDNLRVAIESDLIDGGMRLRWFEDPADAAHTWHDLFIFVRSRGTDSAYIRQKVDPEKLMWTPDRQLLASAVDLLSVQVWQPTKDGRRGRNRPKPIPRPGVKDAGRETKKRGGGEKNTRTAEEMNALLGM
ncbi:DUF5361 domain-containing protein [Corynebacterium glyciniphilum]|uniref:DUF5361 domain-containing protein n=1 Tax=Corynebacterium glyciniphilum TaxID=1404244 RepID=UPI0026535DE9|nr:DUF5361 domain-containing protein [Corynebacterium glyciniphilum]MDN6706374.1 DUF5361 domain-containing protein [Corynebacterium glyciniphilum]